MTEAKTPIWRNRGFLTVWLGQSLSMMGSRLSYIALYYWVYDSTGSTTILATVAFVSILPTLLLGPLAGTFIDRFDRRKLMLWMNLASGCLYALAATLLYLEELRAWHLYLLMPLGAVAALIHKAALRASIPNLVSSAELTRANSLYQVSRSVSGIIGMGIGGSLVAWIGGGPTMWIDAGTFGLAAGSLMLVRFASPKLQETRGWGAVLRDTLAGFRFLVRSRALFSLVFLMALINFLLAPINVIFPVMSIDILNAGSQGLGFLNMALATGMLVGGLVTSLSKRFKRHGLWIVAGLVLVGGTLALFGASRNLHVSMAALVVTGVGVAWVNIFEAVVFQSRVPLEMQGRVFSAQLALGDSLQPISLAVVGSLLLVVRAPAIVLTSGLIIAGASLLCLTLRGLREL